MEYVNVKGYWCIYVLSDWRDCVWPAQYVCGLYDSQKKQPFPPLKRTKDYIPCRDLSPFRDRFCGNKMANAVSQVEPCNVSITRDSGTRTAVGIILSTFAAKAGRLSERTLLPILLFYTYFFLFCYFVSWQTNAQLFHNLSHSYMFQHYRVILRELVINTLPSHTSISNAAVSNTVYN